jgi:Domain of unknown function (DUF6371)
MQTNYRYQFEPYKGKKHTCPECGHRNKFVRYIDTATGEYLSDEVGKCDRSDNCGYHFRPAEYFKNKGIKTDFSKNITFMHAPPKPTSYIDIETVNKSLKAYESNNFAQFLINHFGSDIASELFIKYKLGTSKRWQGANIFWQIDYFGNFRTGKIMVYDPKTGKRVKEPSNLFTWVHKALKTADFNLNQCFFGESLLQNSFNPIAVCESEKTAMIASIYLPQFTWLATGGKEGLNESKCQILNKLNRPIIFFPDLSEPKEGKISTFEYWLSKAKKYLTCKFLFSDMLEKSTNEFEKKEGLDLADYLLKNEYKQAIFQQY